MIDFFVGTQQEATDYISKMDNFMGYPNPPTKTNTYTKPIKHENAVDTYMVIIKEVFAPKLKRNAKIIDIDAASTPSERTGKRKSKEKLKSEKAFKEDNI